MMDALPGPGPVRHAAQRPGSSVRSGNYCCLSIRVASIDENKKQPSKDNHDPHSNHIHKLHRSLHR